MLADLNFPAAFCCNCGDVNCATQVQDTRISRFHGLGGGQTTFQLAIPVCAACIKSTRRRPSGWITRLLAWVMSAGVIAGLLALLGVKVTLPLWIVAHRWALAGGLALVLVLLFYRRRRPRPPQTSWYQPVRIRDARLRFDQASRDVSGAGSGAVAFMKLAFTNHEYLNVFVTANRDAIQAKTLAAVKG
jgi:hypothetical protein